MYILYIMCIIYYAYYNMSYIKTVPILNELQFRFICVPNWHGITALARIKQLNMRRYVLQATGTGRNRSSPRSREDEAAPAQTGWITKAEPARVG